MSSAPHYVHLVYERAPREDEGYKLLACFHYNVGAETYAGKAALESGKRWIVRCANYQTYDAAYVPGSALASTPNKDK